ncbi:hypothetical protein FML06_17230 [Klebsiella variicola]|nr:hypothetical protein [Klebsiella variicola]
MARPQTAGGQHRLSDANLPAAELPLLDAEGPVVLVCGDMLDALFQGSTLRKTAQGWWLRVGDVSRLEGFHARRASQVS